MKPRFPSFLPRCFTYFLPLVVILLVSTQNVFSAEVTMAWDAVEGCDDLAGYRVYKTNQEGQYTLGAESPQKVWQGTGTSCKVPVDEDECWFVVTAFDMSGNESAPSNEVHYEPPGSNLPPFSPFITSPDYGQVECSLLLLITTELFSDPDGDLHGQSQWQISEQADFASTILDVTSTEHLTELPVPHIVLKPDTTYYVRARFYDVYLEPSDWSDVISDAIKFTTASYNNDVDPHGIPGVPDNQEVDDSVDLNGDDIADNDQPEVIKCIQSSVGDATIGVCKASDSITAIEAVEAINPSTISDNTNRPGNLSFGLFSYRIRVNQPGATATVRIYFSEDILQAGTFFKYDTITGWQDYSQHTTFNEDGRSVTLEVKDGGYGDSDGIANGVIVDPGGLGTASSSEVETSEDTYSAGGGGCFIATAPFGSSVEAHVKLLRDFRDRRLLTNMPGRWFVRMYYRHSPFWADLINTHSWCKPLVRLALMPLVGLSYITVKTSVEPKYIAAVFLFLAFMLAYLRPIRLSRR